MFVLTALAYPAVLAILCTGAGLLTDRASGGRLAIALVPAVGAAALIGASQLTTYVVPVAPATPYVLAALALAGFGLSRARATALVRRASGLGWRLTVPIAAYVIACAPVLFAGRPTFSSFQALADSAVHMMGADYLISHGQSYGHLDLANSYGQFINDYYNTSYPSGADTLFGGSALLLGLPLTWTFQPFNAFMLAIASGPAWVLVRRAGLRGALGALAALTVTLPALVYAYELIGSVKELTGLTMALTLGALVVCHRRWLTRGARAGIPFALVTAAGTSALGVGFGAWALAAAVVLAVVAIGEVRAAPRRGRPVIALVLTGVIVTFVAALPTWADLSGSLRVAQNIASTGNPGNLHSALHATQVLGTWLHGSYKQLPAGAEGTATDVLIALTIAAAAAGMARLVAIRAWALAGWVVAMLAVWLGLSLYATTWVDAKTLMITSPAVMVAAWSGVAALRAAPYPSLARAGAAALAVVLAGGVLASDALQYNSSNLAPTGRYEELASIDRHFAGRGPTLFTDFDEYAMYVLRDLDVGGPDFAYPPPAVAAAAGGYGQPVDLDLVSPAALRAYPLIVTRRDPLASRPPAAYDLAWQGSYYEVWRRTSTARSAIVHRALSGTATTQCGELGQVAADGSRAAGSGGGEARLAAAVSPEIVGVSLASSRHPATWGHEREGLVMSRPGVLSAAFEVPHGGTWQVWVVGELMPAVTVGIDGRTVETIAGQLSGNSLVPNTVPPVAVRLAAGTHRLQVRRTSQPLAPGGGGAAVLDAVFLTPAGGVGSAVLTYAPVGGWRGLCGRRYEWVELLPA